METTPEDKKKADRQAYQIQYQKENLEHLKRYRKKYYKEHKEKIKSRSINRYIEKIEDIKTYQQRYREENKESAKKYFKNYNLVNAETLKIKRKKYREENRNIFKLRDRKYREENREHLRIKKKLYTTQRFKTDPIFKMIENLRSRMYKAIKSQSTKKSMKTSEFLGASKEEVWKHLESLFKEGMTRENHGLKGWHIDHIKPINSFDLSDPEEQKKCFHYTNLQPLWWWENLEKSYKIS